MKEKNREEGFVLIAVLMLMVLLVLIGTFATETTTIETKIAGYFKKENQVLYSQEECLSLAKANEKTWLTIPFLTATTADKAVSPINGYANSNSTTQKKYQQNNNDGKVISYYEVRQLSSENKSATQWSNENKLAEPSNNIPRIPYITKPLPGSGFSPKNFQIRQFAITCQPIDDKGPKVFLQEGVYKVFNKF